MKKISDKHSATAGAHADAQVSALSRSAKGIALLLSFAVLLAGATNAQAAACSTAASGNWNAAATWAAPCNVVGGPVAADTVTIGAAHTVTVTSNAAATSITIASPTVAHGININPGIVLNVSGAITMTAPAANFASTLAVGSGTLTAASIAINGGTAGTRISQVTVSTGTITVTGNVTGGGTLPQARFISTGASTVTIGGNFTPGAFTPGASTLTVSGNFTPTAMVAGTGTVIFTGGLAQSIGAFATYNNIIINKTAGTIATLAGNTTLTGALTVTSGTLAKNTRTLGVAGNLTVNGIVIGTTGVITLSGAGTTINGTGSITNTNNLSITAAKTILATANLTMACPIAITGAIVVTNNGTVTSTSATGITGSVAGSTWVNSGTLLAPSTLNVSGPLLATGTLTASAPGNTVNYAGAAQAVKVPSGAPATYYHLTLSGSGVKTMPTGITVAGNFTISGTANATPAAAGALTVGGNWSNSGTFTAGTSTITLTGTNSTLGGTAATTFNNLTINKTAGNNVSIVCATPSPTVNATLTLTSGKIVTSGTACATTCATQLPVIVAAAGTVAGGSATSYVQGALRKMFNAAATLNFRPIAGQDEFPVGDTANYTPIEITAGTTSTAGSVTACVTPTDHPQVTTPVATTGIDALKSVNRYWSLTTAGITTTAALVDATFKFVAGDVDVGATTANFIVENYGTYWRPTTLVAANATSTRASNIDLTSTVSTNNDIAIGDPLLGFNAVPGAFNVFETSTTANAILGRIYTKIVGTSIPLSVVAVNATRTGANVAFAATPITVDLLDARDNTGAITVATDCRSTWATVISTQSIAVAWGGIGRANITVTAPINAWRDVRVRVTQGANVGCSTDRFSIRPTAFSSITSTANNNTTGAGATVKAGQNFTINALTGLTGYDNGLGATLASPALIPLVDNSVGKVTGSPTAGTLGGSFGAAASGTATGAAFTYSEVGNFGLSANAVYDNVFTWVDQPSDCNNVAPNDFSNVLVGGLYGCKFGNAAIPFTVGVSGFGRFIPDHFAMSLPSLVNRSDLCPLGAACPSTFTYMGEQMKAVFTLTAQNAGGSVTQNYAGAYAKLNPAAAGNPSGLAVSYAAVSTAAAGIGTTTISVDTTVGFVAGDALWIPGAGAAGAALNATVASLTSNTITLSTPIVTAVPLGTNIERDLIASANTSTAATGSFAAGVVNISAPLSVNRGATNWYPALNVGIAPADSDGVGLAVAALNLDAAYVAGNDHARIGATDVRYGVMKLANAYGSELLQLPVSATAQYWNGTSYVTSSTDSVSSFAASSVIFGPYAGNLTAANYPNSGGTSVTPASVVFVSGVASCMLAKPPTTGSVDMTINVPSYLPSNIARATFGVYKGAKEFIYQRENY